jgi:hypothetical protein
MIIQVSSAVILIIIIVAVWRSSLIDSIAHKLSTPKSRSPKKLCEETEHALHDLDHQIEENKRKQEELGKANRDLEDFKEGVLISQKKNDEEDEEKEVEDITLFDKKSDDETTQ